MVLKIACKKKKTERITMNFKLNLKLFQSFQLLIFMPKKKARLKIKGIVVDDFDLLIGATAIHNKLTLVTRNVRDFDRLNDIVIENWIAE